MRKRRFTETLRLTGVGFSLLYWLAACGAAYGAQEPLEVPLRHIERAHRNDVRSILENRTLVRLLPSRTFRSDSTTYVYLIDNLPLSSRLADLLGFGSYRVEEMEDGRLHGWDFSGIEGDFWLVYSNPGGRIYRGVGTYDSWFTPKISAKILLVVEYRKIAAADPESEPGVMYTRVDIYVSTNRFVAYLMDFMGKVTDRKLSQLVSSAQYTSEKLSSSPLEVWDKMISSGLFTPEELESFRRTMTPAASSGEATSPR